MDMKSRLVVTLTLVVITSARRSDSSYYRPVSVGVNFGTPFDLANTIPNVVAGPITTILTSVFGFILVAGVLAPQMGRLIADSGRSIQPSPRWYDLMNQLDMSQSFHYLGDSRDRCRRKIICHVHNVLPSAPFWLQTIYRIISVHISGVSQFKEDIVFGLSGGDCQQRYAECNDSLWQLLIRSDPVGYFLKIREEGQHQQQQKDLPDDMFVF